MIQSVCILGLGDTGFSCLRFLHSKGCVVRVMDSRANPPYLDRLQEYYPKIPVRLGAWDARWLYEVDIVVISPGLSLDDPILREAKSRGVKMWSDIQLFAHFVSVPVFAVTGTNGKTTVTSLAGALLQAAGYKVAVGGNLGPPACDLLLEEGLDCIVLELSSFQLEHTHCLPLEAACFLNCTNDHLDRHHDFTDYLAAKQRIYRHAKVCVWNDDDHNTRPAQSSLPSQLVSFSAKGTADFSLLDDTLYGYHFPILQQKDISLQGAGALENALAACALVYTWVQDHKCFQDTLTSFTGLLHRCQPVFTYQGCTWYNDSKGTNIGAMVKAVEFIASKHDRIALLLGGVNKGADFLEVSTILSKQVDTVITFGQDGNAIASKLEGALDVTRCHTLQEAVKESFCLKAQKLFDAVVLSPACASFDAFSGYQQRGEVFASLVKELAHG